MTQLTLKSIDEKFSTMLLACADKTEEHDKIILGLGIKISELENKIIELEARPTRDRGPESEHKMSDDDARNIMFGELKNASHKVAAEKLGLSYGQVYSARNGFTFKKIGKEFEAQKAEDGLFDEYLDSQK